VREIQALFARRAEAVPETQLPWVRVQRDTLLLSLHDEVQPPVLMVGLTPAFPIEPITVNEETDERFNQLCYALFGARDLVVREPDGIAYAPYLYDGALVYPPFACAYADGSIGARVSVAPGRERQDKLWVLSFFQFWSLLRRKLLTALRWPYEVCRYGGPVICRIALGNLALPSRQCRMTLQRGLWKACAIDPYQTDCQVGRRQCSSTR
jgi:hypothetical protein